MTVSGTDRFRPGPETLTTPDAFAVIVAADVMLRFSVWTSLVIEPVNETSTDARVPSVGSNFGRLTVLLKLVRSDGSVTVLTSVAGASDTVWSAENE